jgi:hypothetical protein
MKIEIFLTRNSNGDHHLIGGARETLGVSIGVCAAALCDGYIRTKRQQDTLLLVSCFSILVTSTVLQRYIT